MTDVLERLRTIDDDTARDAIAEISRLTAELEKATKWQPLETAPLGPIIILAYRNDAGKWRRVLGWWAKQFEIEVDNDDIHAGLEECPSGELYAKQGWYEYSEIDDAPLCGLTPELWMPLPLAPEVGKP